MVRGLPGPRFSLPLLHSLAYMPLQAAREVPIVRKKVDDVLGGAEAWANVDQIEGAAAPSAVPLVCVLFTVVSLLPPSPVSPLREQVGVLQADPNAIGGRADDHLLQVHGVWGPVE